MNSNPWVPVYAATITSFTTIIISVLAVFLAFWYNNKLKKNEILYKERMDSFNKFADKLLALRKTCHLLWSSSTTMKHDTNIRAVILEMIEIEKYLHLDVDRDILLFNDKLRLLVISLESELKIILNHYISGSFEVAVDNLRDDKFKSEHRITNDELGEIQDATLTTILKCQDCINLALRQINLPKSNLPYRIDEKWVAEREGRRIARNQRI